MMPQEYVRVHEPGASVKRFRPDGTEYAVTWCVHCGSPNNSFDSLTCLPRPKAAPEPKPRQWTYMDFDVINRKFVALQEQARRYCKTRDPDFANRGMPADYRCWCYVLLEDYGGGCYSCPPKEEG
ncbi:MAG TPA: hypothetical protein VGR45_10345 [Stellaceae bacterium]|nr:hypothetical protein [Stellaceae bacterium]